MPWISEPECLFTCYHLIWFGYSPGQKFRLISLPSFVQCYNFTMCIINDGYGWYDEQSFRLHHNGAWISSVHWNNVVIVCKYLWHIRHDKSKWLSYTTNCAMYTYETRYEWKCSWLCLSICVIILSCFGNGEESRKNNRVLKCEGVRDGLIHGQQLCTQEKGIKGILIICG